MSSSWLSARGSSIQNVVPSPTVLSHADPPPIASMSRLESASPRPVPCTSEFSAPSRSNATNSRASLSAGDARARVGDAQAQPAASRGSRSSRTCRPGGCTSRRWKAG